MKFKSIMLTAAVIAGAVTMNASAYEVSETQGTEAVLSEMSAEEKEPFLGTWDCIWLATGGSVGVDPREAYQAAWTLTLNEDGTGALAISEDDPEEGTWGLDEDIVRFRDTMIMVRDDERLQYGNAISGGMIFTKKEDDHWNPDEDEFDNPEALKLEDIPNLNVSTGTAQTASAEVPEALKDCIGKEYVCTTVTTGGALMDAAAIGGEYGICFAEDGQALYKMAGFEVPGLTWTADDEGFHMTYMDGTDFVFAPTADGFDLDFYGSMMLHFTEK